MYRIPPVVSRGLPPIAVKCIAFPSGVHGEGEELMGIGVGFSGGTPGYVLNTEIPEIAPGVGSVPEMATRGVSSALEMEFCVACCQRGDTGTGIQNPVTLGSPFLAPGGGCMGAPSQAQMRRPLGVI